MKGRSGVANEVSNPFPPLRGFLEIQSSHKKKEATQLQTKKKSLDPKGPCSCLYSFFFFTETR